MSGHVPDGELRAGSTCSTTRSSTPTAAWPATSTTSSSRRTPTAGRRSSPRSSPAPARSRDQLGGRLGRWLEALDARLAAEGVAVPRAVRRRRRHRQPRAGDRPARASSRPTAARHGSGAASSTTSREPAMRLSDLPRVRGRRRRRPQARARARRRDWSPTDRPLGAFGPALRLHDLIVGRGSLGARLGLDRDRVRGPWLLKALFARRRSTTCRGRRSPSIHDGTITLSIAAHELPLPPPPPSAR